VKEDIEWWDLSTKKRVATLTGGGDSSVRCLAFSPTGKLLASSAGSDTTVLIWDADINPRPTEKPDLTSETLKTLWEKLMGESAVGAEEASWQLAHSGPGTDAFLTEKGRLPTPPDPKNVAELVRLLDSRDVEKRDAASKELAKLGIEAEGALIRALQNSPSAELKQRVDELLALTHDKPLSAGAVQQIRILRTLERRASPTAISLLRTAAKGSADSPLTQQAKAALERLRRQQKESPGQK
jgi:hypothetical protein